MARGRPHCTYGWNLSFAVNRIYEVTMALMALVVWQSQGRVYFLSPFLTNQTYSEGAQVIWVQ